MQVQALTSPLIQPGDDLTQIFSKLVPQLVERSIVAVVSKAFATCENRFVAKKTGDKLEKQSLAQKEAEYYLPPTESTYQVMLTIKRNWMFANSGIDESNANNKYLLWPADPQQSINRFWQFLRQHYGISQVGVVMTDSASRPLNWGVVSHAIAYCGFNPLYSYIGQKDLFNRELVMEQLNVMQGVAAAAGLEMGEGNESRPFAIVSDLSLPIEFMDHPPTPEDLAKLRISLEDDIYAPLHQSAGWKKGGAYVNQKSSSIRLTYNQKHK